MTDIFYEIFTYANQLQETDLPNFHPQSFFLFTLLNLIKTYYTDIFYIKKE